MSSRIEEIEARANAATEGPWIAGEGSYVPRDTRNRIIAQCGLEKDTDSLEDSQFIANAREDVPYLIERVRELERERHEAHEAGLRWCKLAEQYKAQLDAVQGRGVGTGGC